VVRFNVVKADRRYADNRALRRNRSAVEAGASTGAVLGVLLGSLVPGAGSLVGLVVSIGIGTLAGAIAGRALATGASVDDWDRNPSERPYVGAHTPDPEEDAPDGLSRPTARS